MSNASGPARVEGLDALRGFAIITMVLSGIVPFGVLPDWMYHAQKPPPTHVFDPTLPGLTWVDLVFPLFLFAMGAAFPLALRRRVDTDGPLRVTGQILGRGARLVAFAIVLQHLRPWAIESDPGTAGWLSALLGFALLFAVYWRVPPDWPSWRRWLLRGIGWTGIVLLLTQLSYADGSGFRLGRSDIILLVLANMAVFGSLIWWATRRRPGWRMGIVALVGALKIASAEPGWVQDLWTWTPAEWLFRMDFLKYLILVLPGTLVGERLASAPDGEAAEGSGWREALVMAVPVALTVALLTGLQERWMALALGATGVAGIALLVGLRNRTEGRQGLWTWLVRQGLFWVALGLALEPFQGGIRKDPATLSYLALTAGVAMLLLASLDAAMRHAAGRRALALLSASGQNPMIAYVAMANLIFPVLHLTGLFDRIAALTPGPWPGVTRALFYTLLLALLTAALTRRKIVWRT